MEESWPARAVEVLWCIGYSGYGHIQLVDLINEWTISIDNKLRTRLFLLYLRHVHFHHEPYLIKFESMHLHACCTSFFLLVNVIHGYGWMESWKGGYNHR